MVRIVVLVVLTLLAVGIALLLQRRRPDPPSAPSYRAPAQLDREDFGGAADRRLLIALFSSITCDTCPRAWATVGRVTAGLADRVTVLRLDVEDEPEIHKRYRIDGVPTTVIADSDGVVVQAFFGPITDEQLQEALVVASGGRPDRDPTDPTSN